MFAAVSTNIYYFFDRNGPGEKVQAFPKGLRMVAGSPVRGTYNATNHADQAVSFVCLGGFQLVVMIQTEQF